MAIIVMKFHMDIIRLSIMVEIVLKILDIRVHPKYIIYWNRHVVIMCRYSNTDEIVNKIADVIQINLV